MVSFSSSHEYQQGKDNVSRVLFLLTIDVISHDSHYRLQEFYTGVSLSTLGQRKSPGHSLLKCRFELLIFKLHDDVTFIQIYTVLKPHVLKPSCTKAFMY